MGFLMGGPFYDLIGRTGNNVGRKVKGRNVFSMRPSKSNKPATILQLDQRFKFGLVTSWLRKCGSFVTLGYQNYDQTGSEMNAAVKQVLDEAITGMSPNFAIDYSKVILSKGDLVEGRNLEVATEDPAELQVTWTPGGGFEGNLTDKLMVLAYCPMLNRYTTVIGVVARSVGTYTMSIPASYSSEVVHVWAAFVSVNQKEVSDSQYYGPLTVL
ncbi:MAG: DUF6266 family protein [Bacteroidota bacterium]